MDKFTMALTGNCRFHLGDEPNAWQAWFDDSGWREVTLPHDWSVELPFSREYSSGTGYLAGGIGWYRLRITPDEAWNGKRISITFDGVYKNSRVWCNSYYLGERPNGYISFTYDITDQFHFEGENIIAVYVDRREVADSRWFTGSGITRKVTLSVEEAIHPVPDRIFFATPSVTAECATFTVENELQNDSTQDQQVTVINRLYQADGVLAAEASSSICIPAGERATVKTSGNIEHPMLWSPASPALYTLSTALQPMAVQLTAVQPMAVQLAAIQSTTVQPTAIQPIAVLADSAEATEISNSATMAETAVPTEYQVDTKKVGIRSFRFDPEKGFFLNGVPAIFKGVCVHHDAGCLGAAVLPAVWERRLTKLKEMGCNAIRMSHNPHMPELYDLCDSMGFFVMDEAFDEWEGPKNKWSTGHNVYPPKHQGYYIDFPAWHERDLVDLIRRDRNHPSIIMWSIGNEIDYPNDPYCHPSFQSMTGNNDANKPAQERQYNSGRPNAERLAVLAKQLTDIAHKVDSTHPVTLAAAFPELSAKLGFLDPLDVVGFNYKEHLYEESHANFPDKPLLGSENGHSFAAWKAVTDHDYISGQFLWTGIDYLGEAHGWPIHGSGAGLLTLAGFEKTSYYRRQSFWSEQPMVHLATAPAEMLHRGHKFPGHEEFIPVSERWNYNYQEEVLVKCYTNVKQAEIFLNEKSLGVFEKPSDRDCISLTVPFAPGELRAEAVLDAAWNGTETATEAVKHSLYTTGCACRVELNYVDYSKESCCVNCSQESNCVDFGRESSCAKSPSAESRPILYQIEATMQDADGHRVFSDSTMLWASVENGRLLGLENGDLADITDYSSRARRAYHGQLLLYVVPDNAKEPVTVQVRGENISPAKIVLPSHIE